ncbi:hypothetical protein C1H46_016060 [Malus baccata]|uniref:Uncharacterized protein n=1 Tax=Malus baccata TaxID=106549 RepID=A0A540MJI5_MALBA|nr:hypothetical protein C1H46_016060 [Malus baccata]
MHAASSPQNDDPPPIVPTWFEETVCPPLVIRHLVDHVALPINASGFRSTDFACALPEATIALANYKEVCMSHEDFLMRCYGSRYVVNFLFYV